MTPFPSTKDFELHRRAFEPRLIKRLTSNPTTAQEIIDRMVQQIRQNFRWGNRRVCAIVEFNPHQLTDLPFKFPLFLVSPYDLVMRHDRLDGYLQQLIQDSGELDFSAIDGWIKLGSASSGSDWCLICDVVIKYPV